MRLSNHLIKKYVFFALLLPGIFCSFFQSPDHAIPDVLSLANGKKITTAKQWKIQRRHILEIFREEMYGSIPGRPKAMAFTVLESNGTAFAGKAIRKQVRVYFNGKANGPQMDILMYLPVTNRPVPMILGLNFDGNHAIAADPGIFLSQSWMSPNTKGVQNNHSTEASRGTNASQWDLEEILKRGYGLATIYRGDLDPDFDDGFKNGVHSLYPELQGRGDNFSTIGAWAWGLSRAMDYFETDKGIDAKRVAVFGHSRLGKAALWAAANDGRFALAISNESGAGGAKLFHHNQGENIGQLCTKFPHWFCNNFKKYSGKDTLLPFDQHMLIALIAPRPVYVASAIDDLNSDPEGEFLSLKAAGPVYRLLGKNDLLVEKWPGLNSSVTGRLAYHVRNGGHDVTAYDWAQYLSFADQFFKK